MGLLDRVHGGYVYQRRVNVLAEHLANAIPEESQVLDIGCGDGLIDSLICERRKDVRIEGIDVMLRSRTMIPVTEFDGVRVPHPDGSFDVVQFVDVLHHTPDPSVLLREGRRVARRGVVIKDHLRDGLLSGPILSFMDWVGNARHGVVLPYNYWPKRRWQEAFSTIGLTVDRWNEQLDLYPVYANWLFGRGLHFVAYLRCDARAGQDTEGGH